MNRRDLLNAAVAAVPAATVTSIGAALASGNVDAAVAEIVTYDAPHTPIMVLYRAYRRISEAADAYIYDPSDGDDEDQVVDRLFYNHRDEIEDELMATPCQTPGDFAAKVIISTCQGGLMPRWEEGAIWAEARALVGDEA